MLADKFKCPECNGDVAPVHLKDVYGRARAIRWTCQKCQRDYGYNTDKPIFVSSWRYLTRKEIDKLLGW